MVNEASIVTVTLNPAIDQTVFLDELKPGEVNRAERSYRQAGGKGINVATMLAMGGSTSVVTGFLGAENCAIFERHFHQYDLTDYFVRIKGATRTGIKIVDTVHGTTDVNVAGSPPWVGQCEELYDRLMRLAEPGRWFALSGSLPVSVSPEYFVELISGLRARGALVAVDSSGPALKAAVEAGVDLIKPNEFELAELLGRKLPSREAVMEAVRAELRDRIAHVVVTLGAEGSLFFTPDVELFASAPPVEVVSTVGAGDSMLAGYLSGLEDQLSPEDCARLATVYAWANLEALETKLPDGDVMEARMAQVKVSALNS